MSGSQRIDRLSCSPIWAIACAALTFAAGHERRCSQGVSSFPKGSTEDPARRKQTRHRETQEYKLRSFPGEIKMIRSSLLLIVLLPTMASAGQIHGSLKDGEKPVHQGVSVQITCSSASPYRGETDAYGAFSINVRETGSCVLKVFYGCEPTFQIYSENDPIRYDFVLIQQQGTCVLQRR